MKNLTRENIIFASILLIAFAMRVWNYWDWSFTHDELGAFVRLNYSSFSQLITEGVQNNDTHPALTQLFIFLWAKAFGLSEASIRFPFILAGTASVALLYFIAKQWFGLTSACFSALALAMLEFPILYSQLARPYSFGMFFCLLAVWGWTRLLFGSDSKIWQKAALYGFATALCMLTHYFAFFFAMIVAASGFFFLNKNNWKPYLMSGLIAILLFLPHISVSLHQFSMGGVGQWLAKPGKDFLWKHILYSLNDSPWVVATLAGISLLSVLYYHLDISFSAAGILRTRFQALCLAWFLIPFLAGYYYSVTVNPVLQHSTLLFSFPFLLLLLFSFFKEHKPQFNNLAYASLGTVLLFSTVIEKNFYKREDFGVFKEINTAVTELHEKYGPENITTVLNTSSREIFDFYFQQEGRSVNFDFFAGDDSSFVPDMLQKIDGCKSPYFLYGWSNFRSPYEIHEIIKRKYPCVVYDEFHFNSQVTLFSRNDSCKRDTLFNLHTGFENRDQQFKYDTTGTDTLQAHSGKHSLRILPTHKYCITLSRKAQQLFRNNSGCINVSAWIRTKGKFDAQLVMDVGQPTGKRDWNAKLMPKFIEKEGEWQQVFVTFELPVAAFPDDEVKIHFWNPNKNSFWLDDVSISSFADSRYDQYQTTFRK